MHGELRDDIPGVKDVLDAMSICLQSFKRSACIAEHVFDELSLSPQPDFATQSNLNTDRSLTHSGVSLGC